VGGSDIGCGYSSPFRIIPEFGKVSENSIHSSNKQAWDVFHKHVSGSYFANESGIFTPQSTASPFFQAGSLAGYGYILAWKPTGQHIHCRQLVGVYRADILKLRHIGPMLMEYLPAEGIKFYLPRNLHPRPFQPEVYAANASK